VDGKEESLMSAHSSTKPSRERSVIPPLDTGVNSRVYAEFARQAKMQIGQVAQSTGLSIDTIRFYEKQGLVHAPP
jgi:hypothetical protein